MLLDHKKQVKHRGVDINLIPLINIIFLLLVFFMVAGRVESMDVFAIDVPNASASAVADDDTIVIHLTKEGHIAINKDAIGDEDFDVVLESLLVEVSDKHVVLRIDRLSDAASMISIMRRMERLGVERAIIETEMRPGS